MRISLLILAILMLTHCGTISPDFIQPRQPSVGIDGLQDSGIKGIAQDIRTHQRYFLLSSEDRDKYNKLIEQYGKDPRVDDAPMVKDEGIRPYGNLYAIDSRHWQDKALMGDLKRLDGK